MRRIVLSLLIVICAMNTVAQTNYYADIEGLTKVELKRALHDMIQPQQTLSYGSGKGHTWQGFWQTDQLDDYQVLDRYSDSIYYFNPHDTTASIRTMNIEHIWANSWWGHEVNEAYCDLFNLYPAEKYANIAKSNNPIGVVTGSVDYDNNSIKRGMSDCYRADSLIKVWEPADRWKGDFARTYFYMATCYTQLRDIWQTKEGWLTADMTEWPTLQPWVYRLMLEWARQDPIDEIEIQRNDVIFCIQGNRNPFVDLPQLEEYIWGTMMDYAFHADGEIIIDPVVIPVDTTEAEIADFFEDFETGSKTNYESEADVTCSAAVWHMMADSYLKKNSYDTYHGERAVRLRSGGQIEMAEDYADGCDVLTFYAGLFGSDEGATLSVYYSIDEGETWEVVKEGIELGTWQQYAYELDIDHPIRLRFVCVGETAKRLNIDDIRMTHYVEELMAGDVNGDGQITIADVTMLVNIILGKTTGGFDTRVADVNGDNVVTIADVTALVNKILGK